MRRLMVFPGPFAQLVARLAGPAHQAPVTIPAHAVLPAYVALGHWTPPAVTLKARLELLVAQLSAELSACQWCIARGRHRWRQAFLPADLLNQVRVYQTSGVFTEREGAALALAAEVARYTSRDPNAPEDALARARRHFAEPEVARIAAAAAGEHFYDPATGAVGSDVGRETGPPTDDLPWRAIDAGIAIRGLS